MEKQKVECKFRHDDWNNLKSVYTCNIRDKIISENAELEFIGKHVNKMTNQNVEAIDFRDCTISKVPQGLTKIFPNLKCFEICHSKLKSVEQNDLKEYKNLIIISFALNEISYLPGDLFDGWKNLEVISFWNSKIEVIEPTLLDGLEKLRYVDFRGNKCIDKCFDSSGSLGNATLKEIKDEIREKFSTSPWKVIFDEKNRSKQANGICGDLMNAIKNENLKDFTIQVEDEEFKVHKLLLAARSPVLKEMIENNIDAQCLKLVDVTKKNFHEILNFIYTDELPQSNDVNFLHLFAAAGRLKIEMLKNFAAGKLIDQINGENAMEILTLANKYESEILRQKSFQIIKTEINDADMSADLALQPEKLREALNLKREKEKIMREMELKLKMLLKE